MNVFVGLTAVVMSAAHRPEPHGRARRRHCESPLGVHGSAAHGPCSWCSRCLGGISLALEVVWFRVLTLFLRPTVYGFSVMLATILIGISLGSYIVTPLLDRRRRWVEVLAGLELAIGIAIVLSFRPVVLSTTL